MLARRIDAIISYNNKDISTDLGSHLTGLSYTDNMSGEADTLDLTLEDKAGMWQNAWFPEKGATLEATLQTLNWETLTEGYKELKLGQFEIDEIGSRGYPSTVQIRGVSIPNDNKLRGVERTRSWEKAELKTIANDVASGAGMELTYDTEDNPTLERAEQTEQSDLAFLLALTKDHGLALKITENKVVIFDEAKYEQVEPKITIVKPNTSFFMASSGTYVTEVLSYSLSNKTRDIYKACHVKYQHGKKKEIIEATFNDPDKKDGKTLEVKEEVQSIAEAEQLAKKKLREKNCEEWTGSITVVGNLNLVAAVTINLQGFGVYDGKYIITRASHSVGSAYQTSIDVRRCLNGY